MLTGSIGRSTWKTDESSDGGIIHNCATPLLKHQRNLVLHAKKDTFEIDTNDSVPILDRNVGRGSYFFFNAGVVEGAIKATECFDGLVQSTFHVFNSRYVALDG